MILNNMTSNVRYSLHSLISFSFSHFHNNTAPNLIFVNCVSGLKILYMFLRSRGTRERILIWFRRREKPRFFGLQIGRPCRFLQGLWASFSCPSLTSCLLSFVASFVVFDFLGVSLKLTGF